jgi:DegV family protein with EDD domain
MGSIKILTDSTSDLPSTLCEKYDIKVIPMYLQIGEETYKDGAEINPENLFQKVTDTGQYPKTSAPSLGDFLDFFDHKERSIYISVSSQLSSTFQNARMALKELGNPEIDIIDSKSISSGYGQVVLKAAEWRDQGVGFKDLGQRIRQLVRQSRGIFILDTLDYLYHGGRCSAVAHFVSSVLKIRPFLNIQLDGTLGVLQKIRGSRKKAVNALLSFFADQIQILDLERIFITHLNCEDEVAFLKEKISSLSQSIEVLTNNVGCVLATHSGPKPLGIACFVRE